MAKATKATKATPVDALTVLMDHAATLGTSAAIADALKVSGKTVRGRVRAGTLNPGEGNDALTPVRVSKDGQTALTEAHKRAIVRTFAPSDADALAALAATIGS
jgi:hypothetical protein